MQSFVCKLAVYDRSVGEYVLGMACMAIPPTTLRLGDIDYDLSNLDMSDPLSYVRKDSPDGTTSVVQFKARRVGSSTGPRERVKCNVRRQAMSALDEALHVLTLAEENTAGLTMLDEPLAVQSDAGVLERPHLEPGTDAEEARRKRLESLQQK